MATSFSQKASGHRVICEPRPLISRMVSGRSSPKVWNSISTEPLRARGMRRPLSNSGMTVFCGLRDQQHPAHGLAAFDVAVGVSGGGEREGPVDEHLQFALGHV